MIYKSIIIQNLISLNIVIFYIKYVSIDVYSVIILNIFTTPLNEFYAWIYYLIYFYGLISIYSRNYFLEKFIYYICKRTKTYSENLKENKDFNNLRSGCVFEANIIVIARILTHQFLHHFIIFTKDFFIYKDCTLDESFGTYKIYNDNIILVVLTHFLLFIVVFAFLIKKPNNSLSIKVEAINIIVRLMFFNCFFTYSDHTLQFYKVFTQLNSN